MKSRAARFILAIGAILSAAPAAMTQETVRETRRAATDLRSVAQAFDMVKLAMGRQSSALASPTALRRKLLENDVCGKARSGSPGAPIDGVCALLVHVYEEGETKERYAAVIPVFALEAPSVAHLAQAPPESALTIGAQQVPALVKFKDLLPANDGKTVRFDGSNGEWRYTFSFVIGERENEKDRIGIPPDYFDEMRYRR